MTEDVRHSLEILQNAPDDVKEFFKMGGWDIDVEAEFIIETTEMRNQIAMTFLIIIEAVCVGIAMVSMLLAKQ